MVGPQARPGALNPEGTETGAQSLLPGTRKEKMKIHNSEGLLERGSLLHLGA